jgi:threonine/homoserine/homoserine lactone efflux protein
LPLFVILFLIYFGSSSQKIENWRFKYRRWMRLAEGLFFVVFGILMLMGKI